MSKNDDAWTDGSTVATEQPDWGPRIRVWADDPDPETAEPEQCRDCPLVRLGQGDQRIDWTPEATVGGVLVLAVFAVGLVIGTIVGAIWL